MIWGHGHKPEINGREIPIAKVTNWKEASCHEIGELKNTEASRICVLKPAFRSTAVVAQLMTACLQAQHCCWTKKRDKLGGSA